jgi:hypothetical protein
LAASLRVTLSLLLILRRSSKLFFQQCYLLAGELGSGLIFDSNSLTGKRLDRPVDANIQVFGCL